MEIILESDSKNALSWVNREEECPWKMRFYYNKLKNIMFVLQSVTFVHINRETNDTVDALAKEDSHSESPWLVWL